LNKKYRLTFASSVEKDLRSIPKKHLSALFKKLSLLEKNPFIGKALKGKYKGLYTLRFSDFRIIYTIEKDELIVLVLRIRHRKDVYKGLIW
jgi:mRNA interferase RelE/StbE